MPGSDGSARPQANLSGLGCLIPTTSQHGEEFGLVLLLPIPGKGEGPNGESRSLFSVRTFLRDSYTVAGLCQ